MLVYRGSGQHESVATGNRRAVPSDWSFLASKHPEVDMSNSPVRSQWPRLVLRAALGFLALLMCAAIVVYVATREAEPELSPPIQARLELAAGQVTVDFGAGPKQAVSGTALLADAHVSTAKGARALVRLPDGSRIFLRDNSAVKLGADAVQLEAGEYWLDAPPTERQAMVHRVGAVSVAAADAGLSILKQEGQVVVYVARGMATVTGPAGRVEVKAGEQASVKADAAPQVSPVAYWDDWTGGMADFKSGSGIPGAGRGTIYGVDSGAPAGSAARRMEISRQVVHATVRDDGLSETEVDQTFFNPGTRDVEGWYWFTVPEGASVTGFAVETNGVLIDGEFVERKEAAAKYTAAKTTGHAPAILEWVDSHTFRARIFPVPAGGTRRVVLRYLQLRPLVDGKLDYVFPMVSEDPVRIGEFSLTVDLGEAGTKMKIATLADARIEKGGRLVTMRRSGYTPRADFQLEAKLDDQRPSVTVARFESGGDSADYVLVRYTPDLDWKDATPQRGEVVVVVDTSAAGDEASRQLKTATAEAVLRALSDEDRFALVALDERPTVLHPAKGLAAASDQEISKALEALADHAAGGATDLASMFDVSLQRLHGAEQPAVVYVGDGVATSGELIPEQLTERLRRALASSRARLFTVGVGPEADHALLTQLARAGGGASFRVDESEQTTARALTLAAALKTPTITDLELDLGAGLDEPFITATGKVSRGSEVLVLARTHHDIPRQITVKGRVGGTPLERKYDVVKEKGLLAEFVPRLWAAEYVRRLLGAGEGPEAERGRIVALGLEYALLTPFTSVLALESEVAYSQMGIQRRHSRLRGKKLTSLDPTTERRLAARHAAPRAPLTVFGCSLDSKSEPTPAAQAESERQGGTGTRAKGEEGSMGVADQAPAPAEVEADEAKANAVAAPTTVAQAPIDNEEEAPAAARPPAPAGRPALRLREEFMAGGSAQTRGHGPLSGAATGRTAKSADGTERAKLVAELERARDAKRPAPPALVVVQTCSDVAKRPLAQRALIWGKRLRTSRSAMDLLERYDAARRACELDDWRSERAFLQVMQRRVETEGGARLVLRHFAARPEVQKYVAKLILRRAVDQRVVAAVEEILFGTAVRWNEVDLQLSEIADVEKRLEKLREAIARAPEDPNGGIRLVRLLVEAERKAEALALGRRMRDQGLLTPHLARQLGDVLARVGEDAEAVRTYSEIVEFDPGSVESRRLLGDIYLGHGWYAPAYRQYKTMTEAAPNDALGWLRLAAAAGGTGRVDEALRLERRVASAQGHPGPQDPRQWARLLSAARLARLLAKPPATPAGQPPVDPKRRAAGVKRKLKELQLFSGPGALVLLTWEDLGADLLLVSRLDGRDTAMGAQTDAASVGLSAALLAIPDAQRASFHARLRSVPGDRGVSWSRQDIVWDGKDFKVTVKTGDLPAGADEASL